MSDHPVLPPGLPPVRIAPAEPQGGRLRRDHRRRNVVVAGLVLALVGGTGVAVATSQGPRAAIERYTTVAAKRGDVTQRLTGSGTVTKVDQLAVRFPAAGTVTEVRASVGDSVQRGDVLALLDDSELRTRVLQARADVDAAALTLQEIKRGGGSAGPVGSSGAPRVPVGAALTTGPDALGAASAGLTTSPTGATPHSPALPPMPPVAADLGSLPGALGQADSAVATVAALQSELDRAMTGMDQACATPSEPVPTLAPTAAPTVETTPSPTPTPEPSTSATPEPSASATPEPSTSATPEPSTSATPEPSASATPEPSTSATPEPSASATPTAHPDADACQAALQRATSTQRELTAAQSAAHAANHDALRLLRNAVDAVRQSSSQLQDWGLSVMATATGLVQRPAARAPQPVAPVGMDGPGISVPAGEMPAVADRSGIVSAEVALAKARRALASAEDDLAAATLTAPMDGVLSALPFVAGQPTTPEAAAVVVSPTGAITVTLPISAKAFPAVRPGQVATLRGTGGVTAQAQVRTKELVPDDTGSYPVLLVTSGTNADQLTPGTKAAVEIAVSSAQDVVLVPLSAITRSGTSGTVRVLAGQEVTEVPVTIGSVGDSHAEVVHGIEVGARLVVADANKPLPNPFQMGVPGG